jgi:fucose 4-O-acetylase-like acetyltransferase
MTYPAQIQPELFALTGVFLFLALSLLTYFGEDRFPRKLPYIYQVAASLGLLFLVVNRFVLPELGEPTRLWYCYGYLVAALANTVGANIYLVVPNRQHKISRKWSAAVTFPSILISTYFVAQYSLSQTSLGPSIAQITVMASCAAIATCAGVLVFQRISRAPLHRVHTGR